MLRKRKVRKLALKLRKSDAGELYSRWPKPIYKLLRRRFVRQFIQYRSEVLAEFPNVPFESKWEKKWRKQQKLKRETSIAS